MPITIIRRVGFGPDGKSRWECRQGNQLVVLSAVEIMRASR